MYQLKLNSKYILTTNHKTYNQLVVECVGIINYAETKKIPCDVKVLGVSEKVIIPNFESVEEFYNNIMYYKCKIIGKDQYIVVWEDIINSNTSVLNDKYAIKMDMILPDSGVNIQPIPTILADIDNYLSTKYGMIINTSIMSGDNNVDTDILQTRIDSCERILIALQAHKPLVETMEKIVSNDVITRIEDIDKNLVSINENLATISIGLSN